MAALRRTAATLLVPLLAMLVLACERRPLPDFDTLWRFDDPSETELRFREILERNPPDRDYRLQLTTQLARAVGMQGRFESGIALLDTVEPELPQASTVTRIRWLLERGRLYNAAGSPLLARRPLEEAFELARSLETGKVATRADRYAVDAAHMLSLISESKHNVRWSRRAIKIAEASEDPAAHAWLGTLYNNLAWALFDERRYADALRTHQQAEAWFASEDDTRRARLSRWAIARTLRAMKRCPEALETLEELEAASTADGAPEGLVFEEIGECHLALGEVEVAGLYFAKALDHLTGDVWLVEHEPQRLERMQALARPQPARTETPADGESVGEQTSQPMGEPIGGASRDG